MTRRLKASAWHISPAKSEGVKALLKDIFAEAGVPTVGDNGLVDLDPPLFLPASDLVRFLCKTDMLSESFAQKLPSLCLIVFSSAHCSYRTSNPIPLNPQEKAFLSVTQTAAFVLRTGFRMPAMAWPSARARQASGKRRGTKSRGAGRYGAAT